MKTCTQISDSRFRGEIYVVSPDDSARRASPGRRAGFSHVNATSPTKRAGPPYKHPLGLARGIARGSQMTKPDRVYIIVYQHSVDRVVLYFPYRQYTKRFIFRFVF